jgi:hypothetical protein
VFRKSGRIGGVHFDVKRQYREATSLTQLGDAEKFRYSSICFCFRSYWRIRLAAYGARLERVLGSRPRGFKSPILRGWPRSSDRGLFAFRDQFQPLFRTYFSFVPAPFSVVIRAVTGRPLRASL